MKPTNKVRSPVQGADACHMCGSNNIDFLKGIKDPGTSCPLQDLSCTFWFVAGGEATQISPPVIGKSRGTIKLGWTLELYLSLCGSTDVLQDTATVENTCSGSVRFMTLVRT